MKIREDLSTYPLDRTLEAIDAGDLVQAKINARMIWEETRPIHDLYGDMAALFITYIAERLGEDAVEESWRMIGEELWKPVMIRILESEGPTGLAKAHALMLRSHGYKFHVEEDHEKFVFFSEYCPSGGRMMQEGKLQGDTSHPMQLGCTKKPNEWSYNREGLPYYCVHTPLWMDMMPNEWGWDVMQSEDGYNGLCCGKTTIYKEPKNNKGKELPRKEQEIK